MLMAGMTKGFFAAWSLVDKVENFFTSIEGSDSFGDSLL